MFENIKEKLHNSWNWLKTKTKQVLISLGIIGVVLAAPLAMDKINEVPDEHKLKCNKDKIYYSREIKKEIDIDGNEKEVDKIEYWFVELDNIDKNEIIEKRTKNTKHFETGKKGQIKMEISVGLPYEKIDGLWYIHKKEKIPRKYYEKQVKSSISRLLGTVYAVDVNEQVGADADDCYTFGGAARDDREYVYMNYDNASSLYSGFRFQTVNIPQGATIDTAKLSVIGYSFLNIRVTLYGEDTDDSAILEGGTLLDNRTLTTANVAWSENNISASEFNDSPEIKTIIKEIVDRGGWVANNDMTIIGSDTQSSEKCEVEDYSYNTAGAAKLFVTYTAIGAERRIIPAH